MKLMVYPASKEVSSMARYSNQLVGIDQVEFVVPKGRAKEGDDFCVLDGGELTGKIITNNYDASFEKSDSIYFADSSYSISQSYISEKINLAMKAGKTIFVDHKVGVETDCSAYHRDNPDIFTPEKSKKYLDEPAPLVQAIPVPVIYVMGLGPNTSKFDIQIALRSAFADRGYSVSQIGSKKLASFFGFESFPDTLFTGHFSAKEKIVLLNRFFYNKYLKEKPDVMIIGVPGGIMPLNHLRYEEVCEMPFLLAQAVPPDASVLCIYYHAFTQEYLSMLRELCKYRYNIPVDHIVVSNTDANLSTETCISEFETIPISKIDIEDLNKEYGLNLYCALSQCGMSRLGDRVIETLIHNL